MSVITGSSVHDQRVERFKRDLNIHCADVIKAGLYGLEQQGLLDPSNNTDLFCLHYVYVPRKNQLLEEFVNPHIHHSISTENNLTPLQLYNNNQHLLIFTVLHTNGKILGLETSSQGRHLFKFLLFAAHQMMNAMRISVETSILL